MYSTTTSTATYTVVDIRKTFEGFDADLRMIARRTEKMPVETVEKYIHDILLWAESKYLKYIDIVLVGSLSKPLRAVRYTVAEDGKAITGDRAGNNDWPNIQNSSLEVIVAFNDRWKALSEGDKRTFYSSKTLKINWAPSTIDNSYSHLSRGNTQLYASNKYEIKKENFI